MSMNNTTPRSHHRPVRAGVLTSFTLLALAACQSGDLPNEDLGITRDQLIRQDLGTSGRSLHGRWVGEAQDIFNMRPDGTIPPYRFPSGSTKITLEIENVDGIDTNDEEYSEQFVKLTFGEGNLPAPEAGVAYPPDFDAWGSSDTGYGTHVPPFEGFEYNLQARDLNFESLDFILDRHEPYTQWCELQPAQPQGDGAFGCLGAMPGFVYRGPDDACLAATSEGTQLEADCNMAALCLTMLTEPICTCDESNGCWKWTVYDASLVLRPIGDELIGSLTTGLATSEPDVFLPVGLIRFRRATD